MTEVEHLRNQCTYLQKEIQSLQQQLKDSDEIIKLNKQQLRICYDPKLFEQNSENKAAVVLLKFTQEENQKLHQKLQQLCYERNMACDKAFICEQISESNQKIEQSTIETLLQNIKELKHRLSQKQTQRNIEGCIYMEKTIVSPDLQTIVYNNQIQQMNSMLLKYQLQIDELIDQKNELAQLNFSLSNEILKMRTQRFTPKNQAKTFCKNMNYISLLVSSSEDPSRFINNLVQLQKKLFFDEDSGDEKDQMQKSGLFSPLFSPSLPQKVKKQFKPVREFQVGESNIPKLDLTKAQQIQQFNIKRMQLLQNKISSEIIEQKLIIMQEEIIRTKNKYHAQLVLNQQLDTLLSELKIKIAELENSNEILIKANQNYEDKWNNLFKQFSFYKEFYLKFKDQIPEQQSLQEFNSKSQFDSLLNTSKLNVTKKGFNANTQIGLSLINYNDDMIPYSQPRLTTENKEDPSQMKTSQYKQYILNMAMELINIDFEKIHQYQPQENQVRIKRSYSSMIEYVKTTQ